MQTSGIEGDGGADHRLPAARITAGSGFVVAAVGHKRQHPGIDPALIDLDRTVSPED